jgi:hypothetical protein
MKHLKTFENNNIEIVNKSRLGKNWDPKRIVRGEQGLMPHILSTEQVAHGGWKCWEPKEYPTSSEKVVFMTEDECVKLNTLFMKSQMEESKYNRLLEEFKNR